jgi:hypothetical protein
MATTKSNTPAVREVDLTMRGALPSEAIAEAVKSGTKLRVNIDKADISAAMLARKLGATSIDELDASGELDNIEQVYGRAVCVLGVGFRNSDDQYAKGEGSLGVYTVLNVATTDGEYLTVGTGALDVVVTACKLLELDALGTWWIIAPAEKATDAGYTPLNMRRAAQPAGSNAEPF